ncbi:hypothetical protein K0M31_009323 [Melipona bicolor]|uniref:Uncharacterized protein n=1 Tax=Melipona bicolor TaxID=60889 RepID=A0AA40FPA8_9HYME|nr:hypothetical protein K0M31_009323 [Melipona bicolor]
MSRDPEQPRGLREYYPFRYLPCVGLVTGIGQNPVALMLRKDHGNLSVKQRRRVEQKKERDKGSGPRRPTFTGGNFHPSIGESKPITTLTLAQPSSPLPRPRFRRKEQMKIKRRRIKSLQKSVDFQAGQSLTGEGDVINDERGDSSPVPRTDIVVSRRGNPNDD